MHKKVISRDLLQKKALERYGTLAEFHGYYHHYSEGLFIKATGFLKSGQFAVDAGCYLGDNAFAMAKAMGNTGDVWTFEPDPRMWTEMSKRIISNASESRGIRLFNEALGLKNEITKFVVPLGVFGVSGLREKANYGSHDVQIVNLSVVCRKLDDLIEEHRIDPKRLALIKFDLEGGELNAFRGAVESIKKGRPLIEFECGGYETYGFTFADIINFWNDLDYTIVDAFGYAVPTAEVLAESIGWNNFAIPNDKPEALAFIQMLVEENLPLVLQKS